MSEKNIEKPEFYYQEFEDYLFDAIIISRNLNADYCCDSDDVLRKLSLARGEIDMFLLRVDEYRALKNIEEANKRMKELEPEGNLVAPSSL